MVDDEHIQSIMLAQIIELALVWLAFFPVDGADLLAGFTHGFFLHEIIVTVKAEANGCHESDDEENRKKADIESSLKL